MRSTLALVALVMLGGAACGAGDSSEDLGSGGGGGESVAPEGGSPPTGGSGEGGNGGSGQNTLGPELCPTNDVALGIEVGQRLPEISVRRCTGEVVSLDAFCGAQALWIFAAHGWCPLCQAVSGEAEAIQQEYAAQGLVSLNIVVETGTSDEPDQNFCELWQSTYGHAEVVTLYDPDGEVLALWPEGSSSLSAFVDSDRIIRSKLSHEDDLSIIRAEIEAALADE